LSDHHAESAKTERAGLWRRLCSAFYANASVLAKKEQKVSERPDYRYNVTIFFQKPHKSSIIWAEFHHVGYYGSRDAGAALRRPIDP
jgi:hypothetical protein